MKKVTPYGNNPTTRFLIVSAQAKVDEEYIDNEMKKHKDSDKITFEVLNMLEDNLCSLEGNVNDKDEFLMKLNKSKPTTIILAYRHGLNLGVRFPKPKPNTVPWLMQESGMVSKRCEILCCNETTVTFLTKDVY